MACPRYLNMLMPAGDAGGGAYGWWGILLRELRNQLNRVRNKEGEDAELRRSSRTVVVVKGPSSVAVLLTLCRGEPTS